MSSKSNDGGPECIPSWVSVAAALKLVMQDREVRFRIWRDSSVMIPRGCVISLMSVNNPHFQKRNTCCSVTFSGRRCFMCDCSKAVSHRLSSWKSCPLAILQVHQNDGHSSFSKHSSVSVTKIDWNAQLPVSSSARRCCPPPCSLWKALGFWGSVEWQVTRICWRSQSTRERQQISERDDECIHWRRTTNADATHWHRLSWWSAPVQPMQLNAITLGKTHMRCVKKGNTDLALNMNSMDCDPFFFVAEMAGNKKTPVTSWLVTQHTRSQALTESGVHWMGEWHLAIRITETLSCSEMEATVLAVADASMEPHWSHARVFRRCILGRHVSLSLSSMCHTSRFRNVFGVARIVVLTFRTAFAHVSRSHDTDMWSWLCSILQIHRSVWWRGPSHSGSASDLWRIIPIFYDPKNNHIFASAYFCDASDTCSYWYVILMIYVKIFRVFFSYSDLW